MSRRPHVLVDDDRRLTEGSNVTLIHLKLRSGVRPFPLACVDARPADATDERYDVVQKREAA